MIGPRAARNRVARALAETWMLFPAVEEYTGWMETAGFTDVQVRELAPDWYRDRRAPYALAVSRRQARRRGRRRPRAQRRWPRQPASRARFAARFVRGLRGRCRVHPDRRRRSRCAPRRRGRAGCGGLSAPRAATPRPPIRSCGASAPHTLIGTALSIVGST